MPTETWRNLPADKRDRITAAAMAEFGAKGFSAGSLNVVAREAGIAKGSLFQYFDDKLDLFAAVCDAGSTRIAQATIGVVDPDRPVFEILRQTIAEWLRYFRANPPERRMAFAAANEIDPAARVAVRSVANTYYDTALRPVIERAMAKGELRAGTDVDLVVSMVALTLRHLNSAPFDPVGDPAYRFHELPDAEVDRIARGYVDALERAFGPASPVA